MDAPMTDDFVMTLIERESKNRDRLDLVYDTLKAMSFDLEACFERAPHDDLTEEFIVFRDDLHDDLDNIEDIFTREGWS